MDFLRDRPSIHWPMDADCSSYRCLRRLPESADKLRIPGPGTTAREGVPGIAGEKSGEGPRITVPAIRRALQELLRPTAKPDCTYSRAYPVTGGGLSCPITASSSGTLLNRPMRNEPTR